MTDIFHNKHILIVAGGTGGHVFPAQAFGQFLVGKKAVLSYATDARGNKLPDWPNDTTVIRAAPPKKNLPGLIRFLWQTTIGCVQSFRLLGEKRPHAVIGFGGYVSFPVLLMAIFRGIPIFLHEQNAIMGKVNKLFARYANGLGRALGEEGTLVGMPLRPALKQHPVARLYNPPMEDGYFQLLILGGSQGAQALSTSIPEAFQKLPQEMRQRLKIHHQVRACDMEKTMALYHDIGMSPQIAPFFDDVGSILSKAHLVISRAGASSIAEIQHFRRPTIFVPYPYAAEDHQTFNCQELVKKGVAWSIKEGENFKETLAQTVKDLYDTPQGLISASEHMLLTAPDAPEEALMTLMIPTLKEVV